MPVTCQITTFKLSLVDYEKNLLESLLALRIFVFVFSSFVSLGYSNIVKYYSDPPLYRAKRLENA